MMVQRARKNGFPFINRFRKGATQDQIAAAFETYAQVNRVNIRHSIAISALSTMQEDICHVVQEKRVAMIILPFHKLWRGEGEEAMENVNHGWRMVNQMVLKRAPCSVTVLVDRGFSCEPKQEAGPSKPKGVCILFFGGPDDREALELGGRMAEHPALRLTILRFLEKTGDEGMDQSHSCSTIPMNNEREKVTFCSSESLNFIFLFGFASNFICLNGVPMFRGLKCNKRKFHLFFFTNALTRNWMRLQWP